MMSWLKGLCGLTLGTCLLFGARAARADAPADTSSPAPIEVGSPAPAEKLRGTDGHMHSMRDEVGKKWLIVSWYPKAFTSGCTLECANLTNERAALSHYQAVLYGASVDEVATNKSFAKHNGYNFVLLSDPEKVLATRLGVLDNASGVAHRWTYIIDDKGVIRAIDREVHPGSAGADLVKELEQLNAPTRKD
jgi:peroxiredoxin Q/BCP